MTNTPISQYIRSFCGLDMPAPMLERAIRQRMAACLLIDREDYTARLQQNEVELRQLIELLVVPETWFFRHEAAFHAAAAFARRLRSLNNRPVRLLSLPCSTGEEPYSLVMALLDAGLGKEEFEVEAVDISAQALSAARRGIYGRNAFRSNVLAFRDRHFEPMPEKSTPNYLLRETIRDQVAFRQGNLLQMTRSAPAKRYDVIFCRNLLIYFDAATQAQALQIVHALLTDDGLLFTGSAETAVCSKHGFVKYPLPGASALYKASKANIVEALPAAPRQSKPATRQANRRNSPPAKPLTQATVQSSPLPTAAALLAQASDLADRGQDVAAKAHLLEILKLAPHHVDALFLLALLEERGDAPRALQLLRQVIYLSPHHYQALCHLALQAEAAGDRDEAQRLRDRASRALRRQEEGALRGLS